MRLENYSLIHFPTRIGQLRAVPVRLGAGAPPAVLAAYAASVDVDPCVERFCFPFDTLKLVLFTVTGEVLWRKDLGRAVVPGRHFVPVFAFDLDGDGVDEIWFVNNVSDRHPLSLRSYRLECLDARTGLTKGQWPWPNKGGEQSLSHQFRNVILGGYVRGEPVLVTAQGTYGPMFLQGYRPDTTLRWEHEIRETDPGARGSHMAPVVDINGDGVDELMWGERCIDLDTGRQLWCADDAVYRGHSDIIQPVLCDDGRWILYTCREGDGDASPRVVCFDDHGRRIWGVVAQGHMGMGWVARLGDSGKTAMAIRVGHMTCGPDGRHHQGCESFAFDAFTGVEQKLKFDPYRTIPVDLNGDGRHELIRGVSGGDGMVWNRYGEEIMPLGGTVALARKLIDRPGEQLLIYHGEGIVRIVCDADADRDSDEAKARYANPYYQVNVHALGGL
jgi:hypothetical protein